MLLSRFCEEIFTKNTGEEKIKKIEEKEQKSTTLNTYMVYFRFRERKVNWKG